LAPKGTPADRVAKLAGVFKAAMSSDIVKKTFAKRLTLPVYRSGEELRKYIAAEYKKVEPVAAMALKSKKK
jgi:tripartite-type tricarboxylate transporter receptor subunit TctC